MTKIEWCEETWNPITGCTPVSEGCKHCYALRMAQRLRGRYGYPADRPFRPGTLHAARMGDPIRWRKPRLVFVCSMGDLFHEDVPRGAIYSVIEQCRDNPQHTYIFLTKRPERMRAIFATAAPIEPNWWCGVTAENQARANERIHVLLEMPATVRFVSVEPMLGPLDLAYPSFNGSDSFGSLEGLHWVICGAETGPGARPMDLDWARSLRDQCARAGVPFFFKRDSQGLRELNGRMHEEWPALGSRWTDVLVGSPACQAWAVRP